MQRCPNCGAGELEIIAAILDHLELDPQPPPTGRAREPLEPGAHFVA